MAVGRLYTIEGGSALFPFPLLLLSALLGLLCNFLLLVANAPVFLCTLSVPVLGVAPESPSHSHKLGLS